MTRREAAIYGLVVICGLLIGAVVAVSTRPHARFVAAARVAPPPSTVPPATPRPVPPPPATPPPATPPPATSAPIVHAATGAVTIDERGTTVGTIVWTGTTLVRDGALALDVHKASVAGRPVGPCERATHLTATLDPKAPRQTVPFTETNCSGSTLGGDLHVARDASGALSGSFWSGGTELGTFTAREGR